MTTGSEVGIVAARGEIAAAVYKLNTAQGRLAHAMRNSAASAARLSDILLDLTGCIKTLERDDKEIERVLSPKTTEPERKTA